MSGVTQTLAATEPRARLRNGALLAVAVLATASWIAAPALVRHLARVDPLFYETIAVTDVEPAGGLAFLIRTEPSLWSGEHSELLEGGRALERVGSPRRVRREGAGLFVAIEEGILFAPASGGDPRELGLSYRLRTPRDLPPRLVAVLVGGFLALQIALALLLFLARPRPRALAVLRALRWPVLTLATFAALLTLLQGWLPERATDSLGERLNQYHRIRDQVDTVFLGSSRVYRHLDPKVFEEVFRERGENAFAFNLGMPDMRMLEVLYFAELLLDRSKGRLERLIVECEPDPLFLRDANRGTDRVIRWHGASTVERILPEILRIEPSWARRAVLLAERLAPFFHRASLLGRGTDAVGAALRRSPRWIGPERRGFLALDEELENPASEADRLDLLRRYSELHDQVPAWERLFARLQRSPLAGRLLDPYELSLFAELEALTERHGVELWFVLGPNPVRHPNLIHAHETGVVKRLIRFDDPDRYPDFYRLESRFDRHHLDGEAARRMTRLLAHRLLDERFGAPADGRTAP